MTLPTIETDLGQILERIEQNLVDFRKETEQNFADFRKEIEQNLADFRQETNQRFDKIEERLTKLEIAQVRLEERLTGEMKALDEKLTGKIETVNAKLDGLSKRLDTQEFINRSVVVGLVLAIAAGVVKLFFPDFPSNP